MARPPFCEVWRNVLKLLQDRRLALDRATNAMVDEADILMGSGAWLQTLRALLRPDNPFGLRQSASSKHPNQLLLRW